MDRDMEIQTSSRGAGKYKAELAFVFKALRESGQCRIICKDEQTAKDACRRFDDRSDSWIAAEIECKKTYGFGQKEVVAEDWSVVLTWKGEG